MGKRCINGGYSSYRCFLGGEICFFHLFQAFYSGFLFSLHLFTRLNLKNEKLHAYTSLPFGCGIAV